MSNQSQRRRAAKKQRRQRRQEARRGAGAPRPRGDRSAPADPFRPSLEDMVWAAVWAIDTPPGAEEVLAALAAHGRAAVAASWGVLDVSLTSLRARGWSADDIGHVITRRLSPAHAELAAGRMPGDTTSALQAVRRCVELLALVGGLPELPLAGRAAAGPERPVSGIDGRVLARVRALLRKAEATTFPEEAEALTAKAQELITRHAIDALLLHGEEGVGGPSSRRVYLDDPYAEAKAMLVERVARANRCSSVYAPAFGWSTVFGFDADLDGVELLTASLLAQAARSLARQGARVDAAGRSRTRSFRRSFLIGFAQRIGERLSSAAQAQVTATDAADSLLPVLAARDQRVEDAIAAAYPHLSAHKTSVSNGAGWAAGRAAADLAELSADAGRLNDHAAGQRAG